MFCIHLKAGTIFVQIYSILRGHGGAVVTHLPPTSEVGGSNTGRYVGKLLAACRWSGIYSTVLDQLYILVYSIHKISHCDMTYTVFKATKKPNK